MGSGSPKKRNYSSGHVDSPAAPGRKIERKEENKEAKEKQWSVYRYRIRCGMKGCNAVSWCGPSNELEVVIPGMSVVKVGPRRDTDGWKLNYGMVF